MPAAPPKNCAAFDNDVWFRPLANKKTAPRLGGRINHAAFKRFSAPPSEYSAAWKAELSGRLLSATLDQESIEKDAVGRATRQKQAMIDKGQRGDEFFFVGLIYANVTDVRAWGRLKADVFFVPDEPNQPHADPAHAVLVSLDFTPEEIRNNGQLLDFLQDAFRWLEPHQVGELIKLKT